MIPPTIAERGLSLSLVSLFFELSYMSNGGRGSQKNNMQKAHLLGLILRRSMLDLAIM